MKIELLYVSSTTACFELKNESIYHSPDKFTVSLNGIQVGEFDTNVFSLFNLKPNSKYILTSSLNEAPYVFSTKDESMCIDITKLGAVGDGVTDCTQYIQSAIEMCAKNGRVYVPKGTYWIKPITLLSNITLELDEGAILLASTNPDDYPVLVGEIEDDYNGQPIQVSTWEGNPYACHQSIINMRNQTNVHIVGRGLIDGNAQNSVWWIKPKERKAGRPRLFFANHCENVTVHGISVANSPSWTMHPYFTRGFNLLDARINAPSDSPNTDGCDPESCDIVNIIGTVFSVGDDCIAIKSGKREMGARYKTPASNHTIRNCLMQYGHGAVVLGSEMSGGVKQLDVCQCLFSHTDRGLRIKTRRGRGSTAVIDNVLFENIRMENVLAPLVINMYYFCDVDGKTEYVYSKEKLPVDDGTPYLGRFAFRNIECFDSEQCAGYFYGLPEQPIESIEIDNCNFTYKKDAKAGFPAMMSFIPPYCKAGLYFNCVNNILIKDCTFDGVEGKTVDASNYKDLKIK